MEFDYAHAYISTCMTRKKCSQLPSIALHDAIRRYGSLEGYSNYIFIVVEKFLRGDLPEARWDEKQAEREDKQNYRR